MNITLQNYKQLRNSFNTKKLEDNVLNVFKEVDNDWSDFLDLYTDASPENAAIREVVNNHLKLVNKYFVDEPKPTSDIADFKKSFKSDGKSFFKLNDQRKYVFEKWLIKEKINFGDTSQTGNDIVFYDANKFDSNLRHIKPKKKEYVLLFTNAGGYTVVSNKADNYKEIAHLSTPIKFFIKDLPKNVIDKIKAQHKLEKSKKTTTKKETPCDDAIATFLDTQKKEREKASTKRKRTKINNSLDKESVNFYNEEFRLLRRFYNFATKKADVSFRSVQLLYMAFQKTAVARKIRKTSELAPLFSVCNNKLTKVYEATESSKRPAKITFADTDVLEKLSTLVANKKVNYTITLLNRVINIQGTAPEDTKVTRLISAIKNAIKNGKVDERSRLFNDLEKATKHLQKYVDDKIEKIQTVQYGLTGVKKKEKTVVNVPYNTEIETTTLTIPAPIVLPIAPPIKVSVQEPFISGALNGAILGQQVATEKATTNKTKQIVKPTTKKVAKNPFKSSFDRLNEVTEAANLYQLKNEHFASLLGKIEIKPKQSLVITLDSKAGGGKTHTCYQFAQAFAESGYKPIIWSLEEHVESNLSRDKQQKYFDETTQPIISVESESTDLNEEQNYRRIIESIKYFDVILVDSLTKLTELNKKFKLDKDFRKAFDGKLFILIKTVARKY